MDRAVAPGQATPFVGRDRDLRELRDDLDRTAAGRGGLVLVAGEAGIGKTRLLEELSGHTVESRWTVAGVTCRGDEGAPPFWPWARVLRELDVDPSLDSRLDRERLLPLLPAGRLRLSRWRKRGRDALVPAPPSTTPR